MRTTLPLALLLASTIVGPAHALLVNGGFETGDFTGWTINFTPSDDTGLPNPALIWNTSYGAARVHDGSYSVDFNYLDATPSAVMSQTFATTVGGTYDATFWFGATAAAGKTAAMAAAILGADGSTVLASDSYVLSGNNDTQWTFRTLSFTADGAQATIRFTDTSTETFATDGLLDTVAVQGVPEPSGLAALLVGAVALATRRRR
jgi:hypothetical protein